MSKKINLDLTQIDGNAMFIIGAFRRQAKKEKWTNDEIKAVTADAMSGDYDHLLRAFLNVCEDRGDEEVLENEYP
jgi:predicted Mrr-cat superfamily restriction endonuclease